MHASLETSGSFYYMFLKKLAVKISTNEVAGMQVIKRDTRFITLYVPHKWMHLELRGFFEHQQMQESILLERRLIQFRGRVGEQANT